MQWFRIYCYFSFLCCLFTFQSALSWSHSEMNIYGLISSRTSFSISYFYHFIFFFRSSVEKYLITSDILTISNSVFLLSHSRYRQTCTHNWENVNFIKFGEIILGLDILFRQITTSLKIRVAFIFGCQILVFINTLGITT